MTSMSDRSSVAGLFGGIERSRRTGATRLGAPSADKATALVIYERHEEVDKSSETKSSVVRSSLQQRDRRDLLDG